MITIQNILNLVVLVPIIVACACRNRVKAHGFPIKYLSGVIPYHSGQKSKVFTFNEYYQSKVEQ